MLEQSESSVKESLTLFDDPVLLSCKSGAEYLLTQLQPFRANFARLLASHRALKQDTSGTNQEQFAELISQLRTYTDLVTQTVVHGKITSITAAESEQSDGMNIQQQNNVKDTCYAYTYFLSNALSILKCLLSCVASLAATR